jgi:hypothetical protein
LAPESAHPSDTQSTAAGVRMRTTTTMRMAMAATTALTVHITETVNTTVGLTRARIPIPRDTRATTTIEPAIGSHVNADSEPECGRPTTRWSSSSSCCGGEVMNSISEGAIADYRGSNGFAYRTGMAKFEPPKSRSMATFTAITLPSALNSGPPDPPDVVWAS